jgi:membrane protease YdiL (CAAX protease family)
VENNSTWAPSEPSPTTWSRKSFPVALTIIGALGALPVALIPTLLYFGYLSGTHQLPHHVIPAQVPIRFVIIAQIVSYVPLMLYLLLTVPLLADKTLAELGVRMPSRRELAIGFGGAVVMWLSVAAASGVISALTRVHETEPAVAFLHELRSTPQIIGFIAIAVAFAPIVEEFAFRVFLFNAIARYSSTTIGAVISGIVFGLVHGTGVSVVIPLAFGGVVLAMVYARSGCYWANVLTHGLFNLTSVIAVLVFHVSDS